MTFTVELLVWFKSNCFIKCHFETLTTDEACEGLAEEGQ